MNENKRHLHNVMDIFVLCFSNNNTGLFSKAGFSQEAVNQLLFGLFSVFWTISIVNYGRPFILVLLNHTSKKKVDKSHP